MASAWAASLFAHAAFVSLGALYFAAQSITLPPPDVAPKPTVPDTIVAPDSVDIFVATDGTRDPNALRLPYAPDLVPRGGGEGEPRVDSGRAGRGGTDTAEHRAVNLADHADDTYLSRDVQTRSDRDQIQRVKSAKDRASREDYRAALEPMELTFVASGHFGTRPERRPDAGVDPSRGGSDRGAPTKQGGAIGGDAPPVGEGLDPKIEGEPEQGADRETYGLGVRDGEPGHDHRDAAKIARARPFVDEGEPSVPADTQGKTRDTVDSEQESTARSTSIFHASPAGGAPGVGVGGKDGPGAPGAGGKEGPGSASKTLGTGVGSGVDNSQSDPRRQMYIRQVQSKVQAAYNAAPRPFPTWAIMEGLQGTAIVTITIRSDGAVASASISRKSGVDEFDQNVRKIALGAGPMPAVPADLGATFTLSVPFVAKNPAVAPLHKNTVDP
ncbi:MAG: energy transducer TonB [Polyangiaceae bacterium]